jgi:hypothetical protein
MTMIQQSQNPPTWLKADKMGIAINDVANLRALLSNLHIPFELALKVDCWMADHKRRLEEIEAELKGLQDAKARVLSALDGGAER